MADDVTTAVDDRWGREFVEVATAMKWRLLDRMVELEHAPPSGPAAITAWNLVEPLLELRRSADPALECGGWFGTDKYDLRIEKLRAAVVALLGAVHQALDAGHNAEGELFIVRERDLPLVGPIMGSGLSIAGVRVAYFESRPDWANPGPRKVLALDHPLRSVPPYHLSDGTPCVLLGPDRGPRLNASSLHRLGDVRAYTGVEVERQRQEAQLLEEQRAYQRREQIKAIELLERQAEQLRKAVTA